VTRLSRRPIARAVIAAFLGVGLSTTAEARKSCAQGGNEQDGECLVFLGKARVEDSSGTTVAQRSFWLSSNIFDNANTFYLSASQWASSPFDLAPGGLRISLSPVVAAGNGGTHRLNLTADSPDCGRNNGCNIDSQNQTGGFDVVIRPPPPIEPPPIEPPPIEPPPIEPPPIEPPSIEPPPVERPPIDVGDIINTLRQNGLATLLDRSYSISDRLVSGLAARRYLGLRAFDVPFEPVMLAAATTDLPPGSLGITPQRDLGPDAEWSAWLDASYLDVSDERYGLSTNGSSRGLILGVDRQVSDGLVVGLAVGTDDADITGYGGTVDVDYRGYFGGPYVGYRIDDDLVFDAWLPTGAMTPTRGYRSWTAAMTSTAGSARST